MSLIVKTFLYMLSFFKLQVKLESSFENISDI